MDAAGFDHQVGTLQCRTPPKRFETPCMTNRLIRERSTWATREPSGVGLAQRMVWMRGSQLGNPRNRVYLFASLCPMISCAVKLMPQVGKELPTKKLSLWPG